MDSRFYNEDVCPEDDVWKAFFEARTFGWRACIDEKSPFKHTAVMFEFDDVPEFTLNVTLEDGSKTPFAVIGNAPVEIAIKRVEDDSRYTFLRAGQTFRLDNFGERVGCYCALKAILACKLPFYNLILSNCRDHVEVVVQSVFGSLPPEFKEDLAEIRRKDVLHWAPPAVAFISSLVVLLIAVIRTVFRGLKSVYKRHMLPCFPVLRRELL